MSKKLILFDIKITTGIAIILVVVGHLASRGQEDIEFYVKLKSIIYKFHMPLFLFLSGYISYFTYPSIKSIKDYSKYVKKKFIRLFPAYLVLSLVFLTGKYMLAENTEFSKLIIDILLYPSNSYAGFLWYIYVLFLFYLSMPIIEYFVKNKFVIFFTISILLSTLIKFPEIFSLNLYFWYLPFYILGCYFSNNQATYLSLLKKYGYIILVLFVLWTFLEFLEIIDIHKNIVSFFAIFGIGYLSSILLVRNDFLEKIGGDSFFIYLFNTMFMGGLTYFLKKVLGNELFIDFFYFFAPLIIFSGIYFPLILKKIIKKRFTLLAKYL